MTIEDLDFIISLLPFLIPLAILEWGLMVWALIDVAKRKYVKGNKVAWILIIVLIGIIGPIVYFLLGRRDEPEGEDPA